MIIRTYLVLNAPHFVTHWYDDCTSTQIKFDPGTKINSSKELAVIFKGKFQELPYDASATDMDAIANQIPGHCTGTGIGGGGGGGGSGTSDHNQLTNKNLPNQHQMVAVTGLDTALFAKVDKPSSPLNVPLAFIVDTNGNVSFQQIPDGANVYTKTESDTRFVSMTLNQTVAGNKTFSGTTTANNINVQQINGTNVYGTATTATTSATAGKIIVTRDGADGTKFINDKGEFVDIHDDSGFVTLNTSEVISGQKTFEKEVDVGRNTPSRGRFLSTGLLVENADTDRQTSYGNTYIESKKLSDGTLNPYQLSVGKLYGTGTTAGANVANASLAVLTKPSGDGSLYINDKGEFMDLGTELEDIFVLYPPSDGNLYGIRDGNVEIIEENTWGIWP